MGFCCKGVCGERGGGGGGGRGGYTVERMCSRLCERGGYKYCYPLSVSMSSVITSSDQRISRSKHKGYLPPPFALSEEGWGR